MNYLKTKEDLEKDLRRILSSVCNKCIEFDNGNREIAFEIAGQLRVLLKHRGSKTNSNALLSQLSLRDSHIYLSTEKIVGHKTVLSPIFHLVSSPITLGDGRESALDFIPLLDSRPLNGISFNEWYNDVVIYHKDNYAYSRKNLIETLADQFVMHVDKKVSEDFFNLVSSTDEGVGWVRFLYGIKRRHKANPILSSIRQIGHELLASLKDKVSNIFDLEKAYFSKISVVKSIDEKSNYEFKFISRSKYTTVFFKKVKNSEIKISVREGLKFYFNKQKFKYKSIEELLIEFSDELICQKVESLKENPELPLGQSTFKFSRDIHLGDDKLMIQNKDESQPTMVNSIKISFSCTIDTIKK